MTRRNVLIGVLLIALLGAFIPDATADNNISRFQVASGLDDAWQRGTPTVQYGQDAAAPFIYLGRSDDPSLRMNGGIRFHTDLVAGEQVKAAALEGFNNFGQSFTGYIYGDTTPGTPDFGPANPLILSRSHTQKVQSWSQSFIPLRQGWTPDVSPIINELTLKPGFNGWVTFLILGGGGSDNQSIDWRSYEYGAFLPTLQLER